MRSDVWVCSSTSMSQNQSVNRPIPEGSRNVVPSTGSSKGRMCPSRSRKQTSEFSIIKTSKTQYKKGTDTRKPERREEKEADTGK